MDTAVPGPSARLVYSATQGLNIDEIAYSVLPEVGNFITSSIPAGLFLAKENGRLREGDIAAGWVASAGMGIQCAPSPSEEAYILIMHFS